MRNVAFLIFLVFFLMCNKNKSVDSISIAHNDFKLVIDDSMRFKLFENKTGKQINCLTQNATNYVTTTDTNFTEFSLQKSEIKIKDIQNEFGNGKKYILVGKASSVEQHLEIMIYDSLDAFFVQTKFKNIGNKSYYIKNIINNNINYCITLQNSKNSEVAAFVGAAKEWGKDYIFAIKDGMKFENFMGENEDSKIGGGIPLIDIWNKQSGIALAHVEKKPCLVSFPIEKESNHAIKMMVKTPVNKILKPGEFVTSLQTVLIPHYGDFFTPLKVYSNIMKKSGVKMRRPSPEAYEPIWCSWGFEFNFSLKQILGTIPFLDSLSINWMVIDDRWFDKYGDWNPRKDIFLEGESQIKEIVKYAHKRGKKIKLWWLPTAVQGTARPPKEKKWINYDFGISEIAKKHPEWLIQNKDGSYATDSRYLWDLCPALLEVKEYIRHLTKKFIQKWDFDGLKLDAYYVVPECYNPLHKHQSHTESYEALPELIQVIYETAKKIKPNAVVELCNCGVPQDFYQSVWTDQPVVSDPINSTQVRRRIKSMKALWGENAPIYADHLELVNDDFASAIGTGGVLGTKFTWTDGDSSVYLTTKKLKLYKKWFSIYRKNMLSKGKYLNLYDIFFDKPETHVIRKGDTIYYAFFAEKWNGKIKLKGLENKSYLVFDYVNNKNLGKISVQKNEIKAKFEKNLLIKCIPIQ